MNKIVDRVSDSLFPAEGTRVVNVKFFPGFDRQVKAEQLADQLARADAQIESGTASRTIHLDGGLTVVAV